MGKIRWIREMTNKNKYKRRQHKEIDINKYYKIDMFELI